MGSFMRRIVTLVAAIAAVLALTAGAVLANNSGRGHGPPAHSQSPHAAETDEVVVTGVRGHDEQVSPGYADDDNIVATLTLAEGDWKVTATGAVDVDDDPLAPNCGLRLDDNDGSEMIGKSNFAAGDFVGRSGFAVTGQATVEEGEVDVHLVCYGTGGNEPFEYNIVAVGG
jgi:hypothetical protein